MNLSIINSPQSLQTKYNTNFQANMLNPIKKTTVQNVQMNIKTKNYFRNYMTTLITTIAGLFGFKHVQNQQNPEVQINTSETETINNKKANLEQSTNINNEESDKNKTGQPLTEQASQIKQNPVQLEQKETILTKQEQKEIIQKKPKTREERLQATLEQAKNIMPYDENGRVNGQDWKKGINIIHKNICWSSRIGLEDWEKAFELILGQGQIVRKFTFRDGGSMELHLNNGTRIFNDHRTGFLTVTHPDGIKEIFDFNGTPQKPKN